MNHKPAASTTKQQRRALAAAILIMTAISVGVGWLAISALQDSKTVLPLHRPSHQRSVERTKEPALFWFVTGLYVTASLAAGAGALWLARQGSGD